MSCHKIVEILEKLHLKNMAYLMLYLISRLRFKCIF